MRGTGGRITLTLVLLLAVGDAACSGGSSKSEGGGEVFGSANSSAPPPASTGSGRSDHGIAVVEKNVVGAHLGTDPHGQVVFASAIVVNNGAAPVGILRATFTYRSQAGEELGSDSDTIAFLDAGDRAFLSIEREESFDDKPMAVDLTFDVAPTPTADSLRHVFEVRDVKVGPSESGSFIATNGNVVNDLAQTVNDLRIECILRDATGAMVVAVQHASDEIAPGTTGPFEELTEPEFASTARTAECRATSTL